MAGAADLEEDPQAASRTPPALIPAAPRRKVRRLWPLWLTPWPACFNESIHSVDRRFHGGEGLVVVELVELVGHGGQLAFGEMVVGGAHCTAPWLAGLALVVG